MSILERDALAASPLADLHALASELTIDGYRRLRKAELIDAILTRQGGGQAAEEAESESSVVESESAGVESESSVVESESAGVESESSVVESESSGVESETWGVESESSGVESETSGEEDRPGSRRRRGRRGGRARSVAREEEAEEGGAGSDEEQEPAPAPEDVEDVEGVEDAEEVKKTEEAEEQVERPTRRARGGAEREEVLVEGEVELLANGSGFLRVNPPEASEDDVYVSAAQVKRCELVPGDRISGPRRAPRRSERFASLIRIDTINGRPADEVVDSTRFEDLPAAFPSERFRLGSDDPTIKAIEWLTPFGQGSRVTIVGPARAGKTEALRRLAETLSGHPDIQLSVVLAGVRPEEIAEWQQGAVAPAAAVSFAASAEAQAQTIERVVDQARRMAARGSHAVVLIDTLGGLQPHAARRLLASARNVAGGGSLTMIATAPEPMGGETTVIALDPVLASTGRFPALDLSVSGTLRAELLVGQAGAEAITRARMEALEG